MQLYYVGVYLKNRIPFGLYGFTSYVDAFTEAETPEEAKVTARLHFETKHHAEVEDVKKPIVAKRIFVRASEIIRPTKNAVQQNVFSPTTLN